MKMRHLRRFSESREEALDIEYIRQCFIEYPSYKISFHCELQEGDMKTYQRCIVLDISI